MDSLELRRKNFIPKEDFPAEVAIGIVYDSGDYHGSLDKLLDARRRRRVPARAGGAARARASTAASASPPGWRSAASRRRASSARAASACRRGFYESAIVRVHASGSVTVYTGTAPHGQGLDTAFAQIVADRLGITPDMVDVVHGDTGTGPFGLGTYGSRSLAVGGESIARATAKVVDKAKRIAAHKLEAAPEDIELADGKFSVKGSPDKGLTLAEIAGAAYVPENLPEGMEPGLEETTFYDPENFVFPFGAHACIVDVDAETGKVDIVRYVAVDDCGPAINPKLIDGQIHGGIAHAIGQALYERIHYDEDGQLVTGTFVDYALPSAADVPSFETDRTETPSPVNSLGVKGVGEAGTIAATPAIVNAVIDALRPLGVTSSTCRSARSTCGRRSRPGRTCRGPGKQGGVGRARERQRRLRTDRPSEGGGSDPRRVRLRRARLARRGARRAARRRRGRQAPRRRPLAAAADEAAAGGADAARRPPARAGPDRHPRRTAAVQIGAMTTHTRSRRGDLGLVVDGGEHDRRPAGPQPRHARRLARARRPGLRPAGDPARLRGLGDGPRRLGGEREIAAADLFEDYLTTAVGDDEVLTEVSSRRSTATGSATRSSTAARRTGRWWPSRALVKKASDGSCEDVRDRAHAHELDVPLRATAAEEALRGRRARRRRDRRGRRAGRRGHRARPATSTPRRTTSATWRACCAGARSRRRRRHRRAACSIRQDVTRDPGRRGLPRRPGPRDGRLPGRDARAAAAARGRGRRRQDRGRAGAGRRDRRRA